MRKCNPWIINQAQTKYTGYFKVIEEEKNSFANLMTVLPMTNTKRLESFSVATSDELKEKHAKSVDWLVICCLLLY